MLELITNPDTIEKETGFNPVRDSTMGRLVVDPPTSSLPVLLKAGDKETYLLAWHAEVQNVVNVRNTKVLYYSPYFTFSNLARNYEMPKTWIDVISKYFSDNKDIKTYGDIPFERYSLLSNKFNVILDDDKAVWEPTFVYAIEKSVVLSSFAQDSEVFSMKAEQLCEQLTQGDKIRAKLGKKDNRFEFLDQILEGQGLEILLASSPFIFQEISSLGMFMEDRPDMLGVYRRGDSKIYIVSRQKLEGSHFSNIVKFIAKFDNQQKALESLASGCDSIGVDGAHLPLRQLLGLGLKPEQVADISINLRLWREQEAGLAELCYYLIAVQAARYAMDGAIAFAIEKVNSKHLITELDVLDKMRALRSAFATECKLPGYIRGYQELISAGERAFVPGLPTNHVLTEHTKTLQIEDGAIVVDSGGRLRAAADLCRMAAFTKETQEQLGFFHKLLRDMLIPAVFPGLLGEDIFNKYLEWLEPHTARYKEIGLMPVKAEFKNITRNVGHGLGPQQPIAVQLKAGNKVEIKAGMICCIEFKMPFDEMATGVEDDFLITEEGGVNLTI